MKKRNYKNDPLTVVELFAGVGGFRLGLEGPRNAPKKMGFRTVWSDQYEPKTIVQHAADVYLSRWGTESHLVHEDINKVIENGFKIPDHEVLTAGFPCQDYSVAKPLSQAAGLRGRKGVLWWSIYEIIRRKGKNKPKYLILENVDRLLKSPVSQRGRDFAIILTSLAQQGYAVEWRVINAAEYGFPQRRRRVFILAYHKDTEIYNRIKHCLGHFSWLTGKGVLSKAFPVKIGMITGYELTLDKDSIAITKYFGKNGSKVSPFFNSGLMFNRKVATLKVDPDFKGPFGTLGDILQDEKDVDPSFYIHKDSLSQWNYLKGAKKEPRKSRYGHVYEYSEGGMVFPDPLNKSARTIVTGEGGYTPSRFKHVVKDKKGLRRLTPIELERLNGFPDDHTKHNNINDIKRAFFMGNALVVGVVEKIGKQLIKEIS